MSEKITRAQAEAAVVPAKTLCAECGPGVDVDEEGLCAICGATASGPWAERACAAIRSLAQQPSDDVVRKAHGALDTMHEKWCNCCSECQTEGGPLAEAILAALPPMPEEK